MSDIFPKWTNRLPLMIIVGSLLVGTAVTAGCWYYIIPASSVCMNCHNQVLKDDPKLALVRESFATGKPIPWVQIHKLPDYVYFNHSVHVNRGVSCVECHGQINHMDEVHQ